MELLLACGVCLDQNTLSAAPFAPELLLAAAVWWAGAVGLVLWHGGAPHGSRLVPTGGELARWAAAATVGAVVLGLMLGGAFLTPLLLVTAAWAVRTALRLRSAPLSTPAAPVERRLRAWHAVALVLAGAGVVSGFVRASRPGYLVWRVQATGGDLADQAVLERIVAGGQAEVPALIAAADAVRAWPSRDRGAWILYCLGEIRGEQAERYLRELIAGQPPPPDPSAPGPVDGAWWGAAHHAYARCLGGDEELHRRHPGLGHLDPPPYPPWRSP